MFINYMLVGTKMKGEYLQGGDWNQNWPTCLKLEHPWKLMPVCMWLIIYMFILTLLKEYFYLDYTPVRIAPRNALIIKHETKYYFSKQSFYSGTHGWTIHFIWNWEELNKTLYLLEHWYFKSWVLVRMSDLARYYFGYEHWAIRLVKKNL